MRETIGNIRKRLTPIYGAGETEALIRLVLYEVGGFSYTDILLKDTKLSHNLIDTLNTITCRLEQSEPIQYILGYTNFCGCRVGVAKGVLIPRPETEELTTLIIDKYAAESPQILDICTGSGCIAIALAKNIKKSKVTAVDISTQALNQAKASAVSQQVDVAFIEGDILRGIELNTPPQGYDIIVSNPPYICNSERDDMEQNVLEYEPHLALFVEGSDPLLFYRRIAEIGLTNLKCGGEIYFEINRQYASETVAMLSEMGYENIVVKRDSFKEDRFVICQKSINQNL